MREEILKSKAPTAALEMRGKAQDFKTHLDLEGGMGQEFLQAVTAAVVAVSHPHLVFVCGSLGS